MALAFGGLTFKLLQDNTIEIKFDGNQTNLDRRDITELSVWLINIQQQIEYGVKPRGAYNPNNPVNADANIANPGPPGYNGYGELGRLPR